MTELSKCAMMLVSSLVSVAAYCEDVLVRDIYGRGEAGARYYPSGTTMVEIISRLLMNGFSSEDDRRLDMTLGPVYGIGYTPDDKLEKRDVDVGFEEPAGGGFMFKLPICE